MREISPLRGEREIWITRAHLYAIGVATCCIGLLAFFVGLLVGRSERIQPEVSLSEAPLVPTLDKKEALDELLARVEATSSGSSPQGVLSFPESLPLGAQKSGTIARSGYAPVPAVVTPGRDRPETPEGELHAGSVPHSGWAIEVSQADNLEKADQRVLDLLKIGLPAYRVASLVDGKTLQRVRIGGYDSKEAAEGALVQVRARAGVGSATVTEAP